MEPCVIFYKTNICAARLCGNKSKQRESEGEGEVGKGGSMQIRANKMKCINILEGEDCGGGRWQAAARGY